MGLKFHLKKHDLVMLILWNLVPMTRIITGSGDGLLPVWYQAITCADTDFINQDSNIFFEETEFQNGLGVNVLSAKAVSWWCFPQNPFNPTFSHQWHSDCKNLPQTPRWKLCAYQGGSEKAL